MNRFFVIKRLPDTIRYAKRWKVIDRMATRPHSIWGTREQARYVCDYLNDGYLATKTFSWEKS